MAQALQGPIAPFFRFPYLRPTPASLDYLKTRNIASFTIDVDSRDFRTRDGEAVERRVMAQLAGRRKGILLFHDIQPSTAHALTGILAELKQRGFKVVHIVPKQPVTTLAEYDAQADRLIAQRKLAAVKEPLAPRALTWSQSDGTSGPGRPLPWASPHADSGTPSQQPTPARASNEGASVPWYKQWFLP